MGMMQTIRFKSGHHEWGPILGDIEHSRHECERCGKVQTVKATPPRGYRANSSGQEGIYYAGGRDVSGPGGGGSD